MDRVFSVDDMSEQLWSTHSHHGKMNRSSSEWAFQRFLQEADGAAVSDQNDDVNNNNEIKSKSNLDHHDSNHNKMIVPPPANDSVEDYQAFLKTRLELACAAVAFTRGASNGTKAQDSAAALDNASQASSSSHNVSYGANVQDLSKLQDKVAGGAVVPPTPAMSKKYVAPVKSATSGSSGESDDDEAEGENETNQSKDPTNAKRVRRMLSNRESARRSRRRKQAHLTDLETQVSQLKNENSSLLKRLTDIGQNYNEAAVDNRVLKADVETLRAKVKMAEETVKRVTGLNPIFQAMSEISTMGIPSFANSPSDTSIDLTVPVQDDPKLQYYHATSSSHLSTPDRSIQNGLLDNDVTAENNASGTVSMQRVASLEHLQTRIRGVRGSSSNQGAGEK